MLVYLGVTMLELLFFFAVLVGFLALGFFMTRDVVPTIKEPGPTAQDYRVQQIQEWEAAYRAAHNGEAPPPGAIAMPVAQPVGTNTMAILAIIFGIGGGVLGIIFGHVALSQIKRTGEDGRGLAIAGLIFGYLGLAALILLGLAYLGLIASFY